MTRKLKARKKDHGSLCQIYVKELKDFAIKKKLTNGSFSGTIP